MALQVAALSIEMIEAVRPVVPRIKRHDPTIKVSIELPTYALNPEMLIGPDIGYGPARAAILDAVVTTLAKADPHFPFSPAADRASTLWSLSSDDHAEKPWTNIDAQSVFRRLGRAVTLRAPRLVLLTRRRHPLVEGNDEQLSI